MEILNDAQCCGNVFPGRESYGHKVQSVAARSIVHKSVNGFLVSFTSSFDQLKI